MFEPAESQVASFEAIVARLERDYRSAADVLHAIRTNWEINRVGNKGEILGGSASRRKAGAESKHPRYHLLSIYLLGDFQAYLDSNPIPGWRGQRALSLFKFLVTRRGQKVTREALMEALWPDAEPAASGNSLRVAVHSLRQSLAAAANEDARDAFLTFDSGGYAWSPLVDFWIDADEFESHSRQGWQLEKEGRPAQAIQEYETADRLYRGDFLQEDPYEEWTMVRREALKDAHLSILRRLARRALEDGEYDTCNGHCQRILSQDPSREDIYQLLIESHVRMGQPGRARRWFDVCAQVLRNELDICPGDETLDLMDRLLGQRSLTRR